MDDDARELQGLFKTVERVCVLSSDWSKHVLSECLKGVKSRVKLGWECPSRNGTPLMHG